MGSCFSYSSIWVGCWLVLTNKRWQKWGGTSSGLSFGSFCFFLEANFHRSPEILYTLRPPCWEETQPPHEERPSGGTIKLQVCGPSLGPSSPVQLNDWSQLMPKEQKNHLAGPTQPTESWEITRHWSFKPRSFVAQQWVTGTLTDVLYILMFLLHFLYLASYTLTLLYT